MYELIRQSARLRLPRLGLLALGAAVITAGLSFLLGSLQTSQSVVQERLTDRWRASYDLLVVPRGTSSPEGILPPSHLLGSSGGITMQQWDLIRQLDGVEVAAPVTRVGWVDFPLAPAMKLPPGLYRIDWEQRESIGLRNSVQAGTTHLWVLSPGVLKGSALAGVLDSVRGAARTDVGSVEAELFRTAGIGVAMADETVTVDLPLALPFVLTAVSPEEEARLLHLDRAVTGGEYFGEGHDRPVKIPDSVTITSLPALLMDGGAGNLHLRLTATPLQAPTEPTEAFLRTLTSGNGAAGLPSRGAPVNWESRPGHPGDLIRSRVASGRVETDWSADLRPAPGPVLFQPTISPAPADWPTAYQALPAGVIRPPGGTPVIAWRASGAVDEKARPIRFHLVGTYNASQIQLPVPYDPSAPLYQGAPALGVGGLGTGLVGRVTEYQVSAHPQSLAGTPPLVITTLKAAQEFLPPAPIGAIRVRVAGADRVSAESIERIDKVAAEITGRTGLQVRVIRGSAPDQVLVHLPGKEELPSDGYLSMTWLRSGQAVALFRELGRGDALVLGMVVLVGTVFVAASSVVHVLLRQRELATLAAVGWRLRDLMLLVLAEAGLVAAAGGAAACLLWPGLQTLWAALSALGVYLLGAAGAALVTGAASPIKLMRSGGVTPIRRLAHVDTLRAMSWGSLRVRRRNLFSLGALVLPTALLVIMSALSLRLEERFFVNVLGAQVALEVGPSHYAAMLAAFILAAATAADLISLSVLERRAELSLLAALGWRRNSLRILVLWEGLQWGAAAGLAGAALGLLALQTLYGRIASGLWPYLPLVLAVPVVTGLLAALLPAESAARMQAGEGIKLS